MPSPVVTSGGAVVASTPVQVRIPEPVLAALDEARGDESRSAWVLGAIGLRLSPLAEVIAEVAVATQPDTRGPSIPVTVLTGRPGRDECSHPKPRVLKGMCGACGQGGF